MKKSYLLSYEMQTGIIPLNGLCYNLQIKNIYLWGLFATYSKVVFQVENHVDLKSLLIQWDGMIKNKTILS